MSMDARATDLQEELLRRAERDPELLHAVYREISEKLDLETAVGIYELFRGQQISFPVRLQDPECVRRMIAQEYDGKNLKVLAERYGYSEKTVRRILRTVNGEHSQGG